MIVSKKLLQEIINTSASTGADYVEVFVEDAYSSVLQLSDKVVESTKESHTQGVGIRVALKDMSVYGHTNKLDKKSLLALAKDLSASFNDELKEVTPLGTLKKGRHHKAKIYGPMVNNEMRKNIVERADKAAREYSEEIIQVQCSLIDQSQKVWIAKMDGRFVEDFRCHTRLYVSAIASDGKENGSGGMGPGNSMGFEAFDTVIIPEEAGREAARRAVTYLHADLCPAGEYPVIIENGFGGVIFHEAVGHSLEATSVSKNASVFCGKLGQKVAHKCVNAFDDGTIENSWGSANYDDEGNKQQKRQLIKNGVLVSYMVDELNGRKMGMPSTGSGRRQDYTFAPTSRMSNTYIAPGKSTLEDMLKDIEFGLYAKSLGGGSVNPATGDYNFAVTEGYLIKNGKICEPVKGASIVGNGAETLANIVMVGNNLALDQGMCGSSSGSIPTNVGQPAIKVAKATVGGRSAK